MAFAAPKKFDENNSDMNSKSFNTERGMKSRLSFEERIDILESNISQLNNTQEKITPLIELSSCIPSISKADLNVLTYEKKVAASGKKLAQLEQKLRNLSKTLTGRNNEHNYVTVAELGLKPTLKKVKNLQLNYQEIVKLFSSIQKTADNNFKIEKENLSEEYQIAFNSFNDISERNRGSSGVTEELKEKIREGINSKYKIFNETINESLSNILTDVGLLRSELNYESSSNNLPSIDSLLHYLKKTRSSMESKFSRLEIRLQNEASQSGITTLSKERLLDLTSMLTGAKKRMAVDVERMEETSQSLDPLFLKEIAEEISKMESLVH